jgi:hypothetical protein
MNIINKIGFLLAFSFLGTQVFAQTQTTNTSNEATKVDAQILVKLRELQTNIDLAKQANHAEQANKAQLLFNEYAAQHILEARTLSEQREQENASRNLTPENYNNWKSDKHNPNLQNDLIKNK